MFQLRNTPDSYKPMLANISFLTNGTVVPVRFADYFQDLDMNVTSVGSWTAEMKLFDPSGQYLESLALQPGGDRKIKFQFGWDDITAGVLPSFTGSIIQSTPRFTVAGTELTLNLIDPSVADNVLDKQATYFRQGSTATQIFQQIAEARGWRTSIDGQTTVEDSFGVLPSFQYRGESDVKFLLTRILRQAVNSSGEAFHFYFDHQGVAHFHSSKFFNQGATYDLAEEYIFAADNMGQVIDFCPTDNNFMGVLAGGGNAQFNGVDSLAGNTSQLLANMFAGPNQSKQTIVADAGFRPNLGPDQLHAKMYVLSRDVLEMQRIAAATWNRFANTSFSASLQVLGTHAANVSDYIRVRRILVDGTDHYMSGVFRVNNVRHGFGLGGWNTTYQLSRMAAQQSPNSTQLVAKVKAAAVTTASTQTSAPPPSGSAPGETVTSVPVRSGN